MEDLQTGSPDRLILLGSVGNRSHHDEKALHTCFAPYNVHGEWFNDLVTTEIEQYLRQGTFAEWVEETLNLYNKDPIHFGCKFWNKVRVCR